MEIMTQIQWDHHCWMRKFADNARSWSGFGQTSEFLIQENEMQLHSTDADLPGILYCSGNCGPYDDNFYYQAELVEDRASTFGIGLVFRLGYTEEYPLQLRIETQLKCICSYQTQGWSLGKPHRLDTFSQKYFLFLNQTLSV